MVVPSSLVNEHVLVVHTTSKMIVKVVQRGHWSPRMSLRGQWLLKMKVRV